MVADKGYDSAANRDLAQTRGALAVIPKRKGSRKPDKRFAKRLYKGRERIEQPIGMLKRFKRIAIRCGKTKRNFSSFTALAATCLLVKSVHTA